MASNGKITIGFKMESGKDGFRKLVLDAGNLHDALGKVEKGAESLNRRFVNMASVVSSLNGARDALGQLTSTLGDLTAESHSFGAAMKAANTMAGKDAAGFEALKDSVSELAKTVPVARDELANGLYQVISNGVPEDNWIEYLNASARSSVGGIADLGQVVGVTSTIIKNYGLEWKDAQTIQDKIQLTAKNGVTSFEQLASALPRVTGNAATLGVTIDELMATFATLTGVSGNTAEVSTQLAAIFTALVKPSSEATKMADEMGIKFDAAAIKAEGGFSKFLASLDQSVKEYSKASGVLEQEVYGKLFGSAESLRALVPLQGELASRFVSNVAAMRDSAGTMDEAYANMSGTGSAVTRMLENQVAGIKDAIASAVGGVQPYLNFAMSALSSAASVAILTQTFNGLNVAQRLSATGAKALAAAEVLLGRVLRVCRAEFIALSMAADLSTKAMISARIALKGLMIASVIGVAVLALSEALGYLIGRTEDAARASSDLTDAQKEQKRVADSVREANTAGAEAYRDARSELSQNILKLQTFNGTKEEELRLVKEMNGIYGDTMGYFSSVSEWYQALVKNSEAYCAQMVIEARTRKYADRIADIEMKRDKLLYNEDGSRRKYSTRRTREADYVTDAFGNSHVVGEHEVVGSSDLDKVKESLNAYAKTISFLKGKMTEGARELSSIRMPVMGSSPQKESFIPGATEATKTGSGKSEKENTPAGSIEDLRNQISDIEGKIRLSVDPEEIYRLQQQKMEIERRIKEIELPIRLAESKQKFQEDLKDIEPLKLDIEVDMGDLTKQLKTLPEGVSSAKLLAGTLGKVSGVARQAGMAFQDMGKAFEIPALDVMGILAGAIATMIQGYATASAQPKDPLSWIAFGLTGLATLTAMVSQVKGLTAFADGGIVSGPTMGLVGEYAGAKSNPEVIAPLSKLREMIGPTSGEPVIVGGRVVVDGRNMVLMLENQTKIAAKSGKKSNIK